MSIVYLNWRLRACAVHDLVYNGEHGDCPLCRNGIVVHRLGAGTRWAGRQRFPCPYCGGRSIFQGGCSRPACRRKAGRGKPSIYVNRCVHCGGKTKYPTSCTKYPCRQKAGTMNMYYRRK